MKSQIITEKQDLTALSWAKARQSSETAGSFLKSYDDIGGHKTYYKLSDYDVEHGIVGHECINEIVVDRLLEILGVDHVSYQLIHADVNVGGRTLETWLNASEDFKRSGESKIALDTFYELEREPSESALDFCMRMGWREQVWECIDTATAMQHSAEQRRILTRATDSLHNAGREADDDKHGEYISDAASRQNVHQECREIRGHEHGKPVSRRHHTGGTIDVASFDDHRAGSIIV